MDADVRIQASGVGKKFCRSLGRSMLYGLADMGRDLRGGRVGRCQLRQGEYWALQDVDFELSRGQCLGVIGQNGSGKSTLLKMLAGVISPDRGRITVRGRVGSLLEIGAGFHPMLSGRENIYVNGAVLGMRRREIDARFDEIVDFAGIGEFLDSPVKHYSSGMYMRLGFSIAVHTRPDVLLVDEALAVGDAAFRSSCLNRIADLKSEGTAILFVSHSEIDIVRVSDQCLLLARDQRTELGHPAAMLQSYRELRQQCSQTGARDPDQSRDFGYDFRVIDVRLEAAEPAGSVGCGEPCRISLHIDCRKPVDDAVVELRFWNSDRRLVAVLDESNTIGRIDLRAGRQRVVFDVDALNLTPDHYHLAGGLLKSGRILTWSYDLASVRLAPSPSCPTLGVALLRGAVKVADASAKEAKTTGPAVRALTEYY